MIEFLRIFSFSLASVCLVILATLCLGKVMAYFLELIFNKLGIEDYLGEIFIIMIIAFFITVMIMFP